MEILNERNYFMKNPSRSEIENAVKKKTYDEHKAEGPQGVTCAIITVSDTRNEEDDTSGRLGVVGDR